jgi:hypothetical protein
MTSSLRSRFSLTDRRAICIAGDKVFAQHWSHGALAEAFVFDATDAGMVLFDRYLEETPAMPAYMLVDIVEEEYRQETIPHVYGRDRRALVDRKKARLFRGTPYCHALMQGRESEGRRDDRLLLTALMNPATVQPWVDALDRHKVPLAGVYSLPLLSAGLLGKIDNLGENTLLVTLQSASGLRQSFFRGRDLKVSRLAKMPRLGTVPFAEYLLGELEKLRRYLNSLRLLARDVPLDICILSHGEPLEDLSRNCTDGDQVRYRLVDLDSVARRLGIGARTQTPYADRLFMQLLLARPPANHYATGEDTRYYRLHQTRAGTLAASVALMLGAIGVSGFNFIEAVALKQEALGAQQKAAFYQARYEMARESLPRTAVEPNDIERAVTIIDALERHRPSPDTALAIVSAALDRFPDLAIDRIEWRASADPDAAFDPVSAGARADTRNPAPPPGAGSEVPYDYYHIALIDGHVAGFDGDYRAALAAVEAFATALRAATDVYRAEVVRLPLDVSSAAKLEGSDRAQAALAKAQFAVRVTLGLNRGEG